MNPLLVGLIGGLVVLLVDKVITMILSKINSSIFSDQERDYIDNRIIHKLSNYRMEADAKFVHKKEPRL